MDQHGPVHVSDVIPASAVLDRVADPASRIVGACEPAKLWIAAALRDDRINAIVALRAQAESLCAYTRQKHLGSQAQLAATEILRRAERALGLAIRKGQVEGRIAKRGSAPGRAAVALVGSYATETRLSSSRSGIYSLTDGVTAEQFDAALAAARAEKNLSRCNVVRKCRNDETKVTKRILRRNAARPAAEQIETGIDSIEFNVAHIARNLGGLSEFLDWPERLRTVRTAVSRLIGRMEGGHDG